MADLLASTASSDTELGGYRVKDCAVCCISVYSVEPGRAAVHGYHKTGKPEFLRLGVKESWATDIA